MSNSKEIVCELQVILDRKKKRQGEEFPADRNEEKENLMNVVLIARVTCSFWVILR